MKIHFIAIGGSVMHNLAIALHKKGYQVSGSDDIIFDPARYMLKKHGLLPEKTGWFPEKITQSVEVIILGMHAKEDNLELLKAKELGLKIYSYPEFLYEQSKNKTRVVVAGSHGKTTITSMILQVLNYHKKSADYMVGAQLEGFETMVHLTDDNDFIILEGDEYLSSPIDKRPKFHLYKANIALLSGISWDHINVFPTYENYILQFKIFINSITNGGIIVYNEEDYEVKQIVEYSKKHIKKYSYKTPKYRIDKNFTILESEQGDLPLEIFGKHNLQNLAGAKLICQYIGIDEDSFYEAIVSFKGAKNRLEIIAKSDSTIIIKDFAHSPSKVSATIKAVKEQYQNKTIIACLELHTYSSLNADFLTQYKSTLNEPNKAIVFYSSHTIKAKRLEEFTEEQIATAFGRDDLILYTNHRNFKNFLFCQNLTNTVLVLMSSGNFGGLDFDELKSLI